MSGPPRAEASVLKLGAIDRSVPQASTLLIETRISVVVQAGKSKYKMIIAVGESMVPSVLTGLNISACFSGYVGPVTIRHRTSDTSTIESAATAL